MVASRLSRSVRHDTIAATYLHLVWESCGVVVFMWPSARTRLSTWDGVFACAVQSVAWKALVLVTGLDHPNTLCAACEYCPSSVEGVSGCWATAGCVLLLCLQAKGVGVCRHAPAYCHFTGRHKPSKLHFLGCSRSFYCKFFARERVSGVMPLLLASLQCIQQTPCCRW